MSTCTDGLYRTAAVGALDHRFLVETHDEAARRYLDEVFGGLPRVDRRDASRYRLLQGDEPGAVSLAFDDAVVVVDVPPEQALATLLWHVNAHAVERTGGALLLHAATASRHGAAVVLPAPMESGKTTLVAGLLREGWSYLTDEATAVAPDGGSIRSYPKSLSIDPGSWDVLADLRPAVLPGTEPWLPNQWQVPPTSFPGGHVPSARPRLLVFPRYVAGGATVVTPLSRADALIELTRCSFSFHRDPPTQLVGLAAFVRRCRCYRLQVDDLAEAVATVGRLFDEEGTMT